MIPLIRHIFDILGFGEPTKRGSLKRLEEEVAKILGKEDRVQKSARFIVTVAVFIFMILVFSAPVILHCLKGAK